MNSSFISTLEGSDDSLTLPCLVTNTSLYRETNVSTQQQVLCRQYMTAGTHASTFKQDKLNHAALQKRRKITDRCRSFPDTHSQFTQSYVV